MCTQHCYISYHDMSAKNSILYRIGPKLSEKMLKQIPYLCTNLQYICTCPKEYKIIQQIKLQEFQSLRKKIFEPQLNFNFFPLLGTQGVHPHICTIVKGLVLRVMHTKLNKDWPTNFKADVKNVKSLHTWEDEARCNQNRSSEVQVA